MKDIILHSERVTAHVNAFGAELKGLEMDGLEYLYEGDPAWYGRTSPTIFPIMGRFLSDTYYVDSKAWHLNPNGFAKERNFEVTALSEASVTFTLHDDERTHIIYPFCFRLNVIYSLEGSAINIGYLVENTGDRDLPFCVGCHTAYRWPLTDGTRPDDYRLLFEQEEDLTSFNPFNWKQPGFVKGRERPLNHHLFDNFTRSLTDIHSNWIEYSDPVSGRGVRIYRSGMPYLAIWTLPDEDARFLCIEPSTSVHAGAATTIEDRMGTIVLPAGESCTRGFMIELR